MVKCYDKLNEQFKIKETKYIIFFWQKKKNVHINKLTFCLSVMVPWMLLFDMTQFAVLGCDQGLFLNRCALAQQTTIARATKNSPLLMLICFSVFGFPKNTRVAHYQMNE